MMRLLIYSQDSMGLGHLRRTHNIAREILAGEPAANILIMGDSPVLPFFAPERGMDYLKLPTIVKTGKADWQPGSLTLDIENAVRLRARLILETFRAFGPDAVLVDHMPVGALGELKQMLTYAAAETSSRLFLGLRDILDAPEVTRQAWARQGGYDFLRLYDTVFVYGCQDIYDVEAEYHLRPYARRVVYSHYVAPRRPASARSGRPEEPFVLVMGGGGSDAFPVAQTFLQALPLVLKEQRIRALVLTGPNMPQADRDALHELAESQPVTVQTSVPDATQLLRDASAVVTMAGYNSTCEVLQAAKKALVVPRPGPSAEQRMRSRLLADRGLVRVVDPDELTPGRMAAELVRLLGDYGIPDPARIPPLDGARRTAELLIRDVAESEERLSARVG